MNEMTYSQYPENALIRANKFIYVGKFTRALDTLYKVLHRRKPCWNKEDLEPIMLKYLGLCVKLKNSLAAIEGLFRYKKMFQSVNVGSLENVVCGYLRMAGEKTEAVREQSKQAAVDIDDLDNLITPESILLRVVSGEDAQHRSDRTSLTLWVKFLWESYCHCLELLRTNAQCEKLYHDIACMAFQFCLKYKRKTEFRKLCDKLKQYLKDISKLPLQVANVNLNKPVTQMRNLETRLVQLDSAIQMQLWREAYNAIEEFHGLMHVSKKPPMPKTMADYYQKLALVFWKTGYYLFHAAALFKLFQLSKDTKKITQEELQRIACRVILATLCIPLTSSHPEFDQIINIDKSPFEKAQKLAVLLTLQQPPTRASLIRDLVHMNVVQLALPELQDLYSCMEVEFNPLTLCKQVQTITSGLQGDEHYVLPLQDVTLVKLVKQVSQVYQTIQFSRLLEHATFTTAFHLERILVDCVRHNDMQIRIDHGTGCVHFGIDLLESQKEDRQEGGPVLQSMPSEQVHTQLINMSHVLNNALRIINPNANKAQKDKHVQHYRQNMVSDHQRILARQKIIDDRKEYLEHHNTFKEKEKAQKAAVAARQQALAEQQRIDQGCLNIREHRLQVNKKQKFKDRLCQEKTLKISQTAHGQKILVKEIEEEVKLKEVKKKFTDEKKLRLAQRREESRQERKEVWDKENKEERFRKQKEKKRKRVEEERLKNEERLEALKKTTKGGEERKRLKMLNRMPNQQRQRQKEAPRRQAELEASWRSKTGGDKGERGHKRERGKGKECDRWRSSETSVPPEKE